MMTLPMSTPRLVVRLMTDSDARPLAAYRSDPEVARHQSWEAPFPVEHAVDLIAGQAELAGPTPGHWIQLAVEVSSTMVGDVAVHLDASGSIAEIGYTLDPAHQGRGYAVEAVGAVVDALFASRVHRIEAGVDPANRASRRVLERAGFIREALLRQAYRDGDHWIDDERWGLLAGDQRP